MPLTVELPGALVAYADGRRRVTLPPGAATVGEALAALWRLYPGLRDRVLTEQGTVRHHVNVFVGSESIRDTGGLDTRLTGDAQIAIIPAISGGCSPTVDVG